MTTNSEDGQQSEAEHYPLVRLDPQNVPIELRSLIPYAERWGITDDGIRGNAVKKATPEVLRDLVQTVHQYIEPLTKWLDESYTSGIMTNEEGAFLGLEMSAVEAKGWLRKKFGENHEL